MNGIDDKYWSKVTPWKQPKYNCDKKSHEALGKLKDTDYVASCGEWQLDHEISGKLHQYYPTIQREVYKGKYP